jgi:hypothetical protein
MAHGKTSFEDAGREGKVLWRALVNKIVIILVL